LSATAGEGNTSVMTNSELPGKKKGIAIKARCHARGKLPPHHGYYN
jgi:hypothetical protein